MKTHNKFFDIICSNAISLILGIPTIIGWIAWLSAVVKNKYNDINSINCILCLIILITYSVLVSRCVWHKVSYKAYRYPHSFLKRSYSYELDEKTIKYTRCEDDNTLDFRRELLVRCVTNRLDRITDKYTWTGEGQRVFQLIGDEGVSSIKNVSRIGSWQYVEVFLRNHFIKGDAKKVCYHWPKINNCSSSSPFFSTSTDQPTKKLTLELKLGSDYNGQEIICETFRSSESDYWIAQEMHKLNERGEYTWNVPNVKRFRYYRIRWSWEKGQSPVELVIK